jgi:glycosyltransferase involved in cell wall biosynthesis
VHAPSSRRKKGTEFIEQAIHNLRLKGHKVELILAENLPHHKILELYEQSDIGIDQVLYGWHGKVSVELMALGKPVICNIAEEWRMYRPDLPIVHADPATLEKRIEELIIDKQNRIQLGELSRAYALRYHDVEVVVDQLLNLYGVKQLSLVLDHIDSPKTW